MLTRADKASWLDQIWCALWAYREDCIPERDREHDEEWDAICTAMAWIKEEVIGEGD